MIEGILLSLGASLAIAVGFVLAYLVGRSLIGRRALRAERLEQRGVVYSSDMALRVSLLPVWAGGAFAGLSVLPAIAWAATGDLEARRVALGMFVVSMIIALTGLTSALASMGLFVLEDEQMTRISAFRERSIRFADVARIDEGPVLPAIRLHSASHTLRIPKTVAGFDDLFNQITGRTGDVLDLADPTVDPAAELGPIDQSTTYRVSSLRLGLNLAVLGGFLLLVVSWPWFVDIDGDHPIRDGFIFVGIGMVLWLGIAAMVRSETFPPKQPIELELRPETLAWRTLRGAWVERRRDELVSACVETTIIYVKGQPGHRYPLRLRFVDGDVLEIDDFRGRHLGASTHLLGHDLRRRYVTTANRTSEHYDQSLASLADAHAAELEHDVDRAVASYRRAIASWPSEETLSLLSHVGELLRVHSETIENNSAAGRKAQAAVRATAIGHYRAHVDFFPEDANAWQGLGALLSGGHRTDLADEAISTAEQLLMSGRHKPAGANPSPR